LPVLVFEEALPSTFEPLLLYFPVQPRNMCVFHKNIEYKVRILFLGIYFENLASLEVPGEAGVEAV
jgi:hypothetical protein